MCLGVPGRVIKVRGAVAIVDYWGVRRETRLDVVDEPVAPVLDVPPDHVVEDLAALTFADLR